MEVEVAVWGKPMISLLEVAGALGDFAFYLRFKYRPV
jgi:hypothetical protein